MSVIILGSRIYCPLSDVDAEMAGETGAVSFGASPVALRAESLGARRRPLEINRATLLAMAALPDAEVILFVAHDAVTNRPTAGIAGIQRLLTERGIPFRVVSSPLTGKVCATITTLHHECEKARAVSTESRRVLLVERALKTATAAVAERDRFEAKLAAGMGLFMDDEAATARWLRWLRCYCALHDEIEEVRSILTVDVAV